MAGVTWSERLLAIFTKEQLDQVADLTHRVKERAVDRHCQQEMRVVFNENGYPRQFSGTDNVKPIAPKTYRAE